MPFAAALSTTPETARAFDGVCARALDGLNGRPQLAVLFFSPHHARAIDAVAAAAARMLGTDCLIGCSGEAIAGNDREVEEGPAMTLWLGCWAHAPEIELFHLVLERTPEGDSLLGWPDAVVTADPARSVILLLGEPYSFPTDVFLTEVNENHPGLRVLGGMASGGRGPGQCLLLQGERVLRQGAAGVLLRGSIGVRSIVSQGCRPIGRHLVITRAHENIIFELGGQPPLTHLQQLWRELRPEDQELFQHGLHVGRVINEYQGEFQRGDFLVRNVLGLDQDSGALAITDRVRVGQTVQFHVRDAETADEDLHALLQMDLHAHEQRPAGALLFTCNGRGSRLFTEPHHDARAIQQEVGPLPVAGFFAQGELGPVGGQNFIHGFTASVALFEDD
jgi:small ligand-binding sensory domain FIST